MSPRRCRGSAVHGEHAGLPADNVSPLVFIPLIMMLLALLVCSRSVSSWGGRSGIVSRSRSCAGRWLISNPRQILEGAVASWTRESFQGVTWGSGCCCRIRDAVEDDAFLGTLLDAIGP